MTKHLFWVVVVGVILAATAPLMAAEPKVAVMDLNMVITESQAGKEATARLEKLIQEKQAAVDEKAAAIGKLQEEIKAGNLSTEDADSKQQALQRLVSEYEALVAQSETEIQTQAQEMRNQILSEISEVLLTLGKQ